MNIDEAKVTKCKPGESGADLIKANQWGLYGQNNKPCVYNNVSYKSLSVLALELGVSKATVTRAIKFGSYKGKNISLVVVDE